jgi:hypothetical protein
VPQLVVDDSQVRHGLDDEVVGAIAHRATLAGLRVLE